MRLFRWIKSLFVPEQIPVSHLNTIDDECECAICNMERDRIRWRDRKRKRSFWKPTQEMIRKSVESHRKNRERAAIDFMADCLEENPDSIVTRKELSRKWSEWLDLPENKVKYKGFKTKKVKTISMGLKALLKDKFVRLKKMKNYKFKYSYKGIAFK